MNKFFLNKMTEKINQQDLIMNLKNTTRCPNCNLICPLDLFYDNNNQYLNYSCQNNHKGKILLNHYIKNYNKYSLNNEECEICEKTNEKLFYCFECKKFICDTCKFNYQNNHKLI